MDTRDELLRQERWPMMNTAQHNTSMETSTTVIPTRLGDASASLPVCSTVVQRLEEMDLDGATFGAGDSRAVLEFIPEGEREIMFKRLIEEEEFRFQQWHHMPSKSGSLEPLRRTKVAMATPREDGLIPHYRFPVNNQAKHGVIAPMTSTVEAVRARVSELLGCEFNHAVVLHYRDGNDCIGYHKDKNLDIDESAPIASVSLGFPRVYALRDSIKNPKSQQEFVFPNGALFVLGPKTNQNWFHSIRLEDHEALAVDSVFVIDKDQYDSAMAEANSARISLTFRKVSTFHDPDSGVLVGKGSAYQSLNWPTEFNGEHNLDA